MRGLKRTTSAEESSFLGPPPAKRSCSVTSQPSSPGSPSVLGRLGSTIANVVGYLRGIVTGLFHSPPPLPPPEIPHTLPTTPTPMLPSGTLVRSCDHAHRASSSVSASSAALPKSLEQNPFRSAPIHPPPMPDAPPPARASKNQQSTLPLKDTMKFESPRRPRALREMQAARDQKLYQQILDSNHRSPSALPVSTSPPHRSPLAFPVLTSPPRTPSLHTPILHLHPEVIGPSSPGSMGSPEDEKPLPSHSTPSHSHPPSLPPVPQGSHKSQPQAVGLWSVPRIGSRHVGTGQRDGPSSRLVVGAGQRRDAYARLTSNSTVAAEQPVLVARGSGPSHPSRRAGSSGGGSWMTWTGHAHPSARWPHLSGMTMASRGMQTATPPLLPSRQHPGAMLSSQHFPEATSSLLSSERGSEAAQLRQWLEGLVTDHRHATEDRRAALEVAEKYLELCQQERMDAEEKRVCRLRENLCRIALDEEEVPEMFLELSVEREKKVAHAMASGPGEDLLSERFRIRITRADIASLSPYAWLNDEIINFYFNLICERPASEGRKSVHVLNSFFYPKLTQFGYSSVRRWTKKVDIFSRDLLLMPIHLGMHWCLAVVDFSKHQFCYYDSLKGRNLSCLKRLREYVVAEAKEKKDMTFDLTGWTDHFPHDIPEQMNGSDCGVFTCMYARYLASNQPFTFSQRDMPSIREHMVCEILEQKLF